MTQRLAAIAQNKVYICIYMPMTYNSIDNNWKYSNYLFTRSLW